MPLYITTAVAVVLGLWMLFAVARLTVLSVVATHLHDAELPNLLRWPFWIFLGVVLPIVLVAVVTGDSDERPGLFQIVVAVIVVTLLARILAAVLEQTLDRVSPVSGTLLRRAFNHPRDTSSDDFAKPKAELPLKGELALAVAELDEANARFARGPEFTTEYLNPAFASNRAALEAAISRVKEAVAVSGLPAARSVSQRLADAESRWRVLGEQGRGVSRPG